MFNNGEIIVLILLCNRKEQPKIDVVAASFAALPLEVINKPAPDLQR